jgi:fatty-acyl-CoA synthase
MRGLMQDAPLALPAVLRRIERQFGHKTVTSASVNDETVAHWAQVGENARRIVSVLESLDIGHDALVATLGWNTQRHVELYLGVPCSGRTLHTLNHRLGTEQLRYIVNDAADDVIFVDRSLLHVLWPLVADLPTVRWFVVMDDGADTPLPDDPRLLDYDALLSAAPPADLPHIEEDRGASLCYTSGTTGNPKGVLYSHRSILLHALMLLMVDSYGISESDVILPIVPMFHVNAWGFPYAAMMVGADLVLPGPAMGAEDLMAQMVRHKVTFAAAVATVWHGMAALLDDGHDLSNVRKLACGGGAVPDSLSKRWETATGVPLTNGWGMTETSPVVTSGRLATGHRGLPAAERRRIVGSPGPALPLCEVRIVDDAGKTVAWDATSPGELQVSGPTVASAYFGANRDEDAFTADGWLRTGDVATIDGLGYVRIVDRTKDLVKSGGEWISSVDLENAIMGHSDVAEAAVIAIPHEKWGERPLACVVRRSGSSLSSDELSEYLRDHVASWWIPDQFEFLDVIPKTSTGKFSKQDLRQKLHSKYNTEAASRGSRA